MMESYVYTHTFKNTDFMQGNVKTPIFYLMKLLQPHKSISFLENPRQVEDQSEFPACGAPWYFGGTMQPVCSRGHSAQALSKCGGTLQILY